MNTEKRHDLYGFLNPTIFWYPMPCYRQWLLSKHLISVNLLKCSSRHTAASTITFLLAKCNLTNKSHVSTCFSFKTISQLDVCNRHWRTQTHNYTWSYRVYCITAEHHCAAANSTRRPSFRNTILWRPPASSCPTFYSLLLTTFMRSIRSSNSQQMHTYFSYKHQM